VKGSSLFAKCSQQIDRESAHEKLAAKVEAGAAAAEKEAAEKPGEHVPYPGKTSTRAPKEKDSVVEQVMKSSATQEFMRTAAREIVRGVFGIGRRR